MEPRAEERAARVERLFAPDAAFSASPIDQTIVGTEAIVEHIARGHHDLVAGMGIAFSHQQEIIAGDMLLLRWTAAAPSGYIDRGATAMTFAPDGRIATLHMFAGVN